MLSYSKTSLNSLILDVPRISEPVPHYALQAPARKMIDQESIHISDLRDEGRNRREPNSCMICRKNGDSQVIRCLCCLALVCKPCFVDYHNKNCFECPICKLPYSRFKAKDVLIDPVLDRETCMTMWRDVVRNLDGV